MVAVQWSLVECLEGGCRWWSLWAAKLGEHLSWHYDLGYGYLGKQILDISYVIAGYNYNEINVQCTGRVIGRVWLFYLE